MTNNIETMTVNDAEQIGVQQYRDGKTFAANNVRPAGFFISCLKAGRMDLVKALDHGWHVANLAEPVHLENGTIIGSLHANTELERICG